MELSKISDWLVLNNILLNTAKTEFMLFKNYQKTINEDDIPHLTVNDTIIKSVTEFILGGLTINEFINWNNHASKISNKISRTLGEMCRLKRYLPLSAMQLMYCSLILSHLQFAIISWGFECERLGPLLFLIYVNDLASVSSVLFTILFADDTNVFITGKNIPNLITVMNNELSKLSEWMNANKLSLNVKKTKYMLFCIKNSPIEGGNILLNGEIIDKVNHFKFLGVIIDSHLSWMDHVQHIRKKISKWIGILYKTKDYLKSDTLLTLYYSFVYPYLIYCIEVWGATTKGNLI